MSTELKYLIALTQIDGIGPIVGKELLRFFGCAEAIFKEKPETLSKIKRYGQQLAGGVSNPKLLHLAETELEFMEREGILGISISDHRYPEWLKECPDSPAVLFLKGGGRLNEEKAVSIVGSREATGYGKEFVEELVRELSRFNVAIHSGLAYGIDITAHKEALRNGLPTYCTLAHGLDRIYPKQHTKFANQMLAEGGWITEFMSGTTPDRENFPKRNRIVAGITEATIVVESARKGGAIITANIANSYGRDVFAVPGRVTDERSKGCNFLIKTDRAHLLQTPEDLIRMLGWESKRSKLIQTRLFPDLTDNQLKIVESMQSQDQLTMDELVHVLNRPISDVSTDLLLMEFKGMVRQLPGKKFELCNQ